MPSRLYAKEFTFDKSSSINQTIYQKLHNSNEYTFSSISHISYFSYYPWIAVSKYQSLTTIFSAKMMGRKHSQRNINTPAPFYQSFATPPLTSAKTIKSSICKKIQACQTLKLTKGFVFSLHKRSEQSVSCLSTLNWSEHFLWRVYLQICSVNNNILLSCVTSPYVQEQGGILLHILYTIYTFNILCLHYITHYCT